MKIPLVLEKGLYLQLNIKSIVMCRKLKVTIQVGRENQHQNMAKFSNKAHKKSFDLPINHQKVIKIQK